jgi:hypothetical protein
MLRHLVASSTLLAAVALAAPARAETTTHTTHWYERLSIRGYSQFRMNRLYASSDELKNDLADRSIGPGSTFFVRRARVILYGDIHDHVYVYLQPDFAGATNGDVLHLAQIRDWYADVAFDSKKELRIRIGQSKLPYGFENMQSSQNRVAFDRTDAMNTAVPGERELGFFLYYAPEAVRRRFKQLVDDGFKGSGDYGMAAIGVYNGNGINIKDKNTNKHVVARLTYPFEIGGGQTLELGMGGYAGYYRITRGDGVSSYVAGGKNDDFLDVRLHAAVTLYPKPIGFQAEYNIGKGPALDGKIVKDSFLNGGYAMLFARVPTSFGTFVPYVRGQYYHGGRKTETNAPLTIVKEVEAGVEWQVWKPLELTMAFTASDRETNRKGLTGEFLRLQAQINY